MNMGIERWGFLFFVVSSPIVYLLRRTRGVCPNINPIMLCTHVCGVNYAACNCALIAAGDFNRLDLNSIKKYFHLKQIVKKPTMKNATLNLVMTNLHDKYDDPCHFPPFGLSDHDTVTAEPKVRDQSRCTTKFVLKRDKRASCKAELGRYLSNFDRPRLVSSEESRGDMLNIFNEVIHTGLELLMPVKRVRVNASDAPWMTQHLKSLILKR